MFGFFLTELKRVLPYAALVAVAGLLTDGIGWWLAAGLVLYCAWTVTNLARLNHWLATNQREDLPDAAGLWGDVFTRLHHRERRSADRHRRLSRLLEQFRRATQALPDGVVILTGTGEISAFNKAGRDLLGLRRPEDHGRPITNFLRLPEMTSFIDASDPEETLLIESPILRTKSLMLQVIPYAKTGERLLIARDVTRVQRLESMRVDFVANVSHELKSPLTVIRGYSEHLERLREEGSLTGSDARSAEITDRALSQILSESERMRLLVDDLLELSRLEGTPSDGETHQHDVDIHALVQQIASEAAVLFEDSRHVSLDVEPLLGVYGNRRELYTAFSNVVFNAVRYSEGEGEIIIRWHLENGQPVLRVEDEGPGIPPEAIPRLTERFFRVDEGRARAQGGTGLGLAITKHVMFRHDGTINIESELGEGTTVICTFDADRVRQLTANIVSLSSRSL